MYSATTVTEATLAGKLFSPCKCAYSQVVSPNEARDIEHGSFIIVFLKASSNERIGLYRLGLNRWSYNRLGYNGLSVSRLGHNGLSYNGLSCSRLSVNRLGYNGLSYNGLGCSRLGVNRLSVNRLGFNRLSVSLGTIRLGFRWSFRLGFIAVSRTRFGMMTVSPKRLFLTSAESDSNES